VEKGSLLGKMEEIIKEYFLMVKWMVKVHFILKTDQILSDNGKMDKISKFIKSIHFQNELISFFNVIFI
jgi:hypothetical protein